MKTTMTGNNKRLVQFLLQVVICCLCSLLLKPDLLQASSGLSARYVQASGSQLVVEISVGSPPPASVIMIQHLPQGVKVVGSRPGISNYNPAKNRAKWLLRNLRPGTTTVSVTLDRSVGKNDISAEIRYKPRKGGSMTTIHVAK